MQAIDRPLQVAGIHAVLRQVDEIFPSLRNKLFVKRTNELVLGVRPAAEHVALLGHHDRHVRALGAQVADERLVIRLHGPTRALRLLQPHVVKTIQHIAARVDAREMFAHLELHHARPGKAQVDDRDIEVAPDNVHKCHAGTRRAPAVRNRRAVEDNGLVDPARARTERGNRRMRFDAELKRLDAVVKRKMHEARIARSPGDAQFRARSAHDPSGLDVDPFVLRLVEPVDVNAADSRRGHVIHRKTRVVRNPFEGKLARIGLEAKLHARRVMFHRANALIDVRRHVRGQSVVPMLHIVEGASFDRQEPSVNPLDAVCIDDRRLHGHARIPFGDLAFLCRRTHSRKHDDCNSRENKLLFVHHISHSLSFS